MSLANGNDGSEGLCECLSPLQRRSCVDTDSFPHTLPSVYSSAPATAVNSLAVASVDNLVTPGMGVVIGDTTAVLMSGDPLTIDNTTAFPIYVASTTISDTVNLGCSAFGDDVDLAGKVAIVVRGSCAFSVKAQNVLDAGGDIVLCTSVHPSHCKVFAC